MNRDELIQRGEEFLAGRAEGYRHGRKDAGDIQWIKLFFLVVLGNIASWMALLALIASFK